MGRHLDLAADLLDIADQVRTAGLAAEVDPADLNAPGVWVKFVALRHDLLDGYTLAVDLILFTSDTDPAAAAAALSQLHNTVVDLIDPAGEITSVGFQLPDSPLLPALRVPIEATGTYL